MKSTSKKDPVCSSSATVRITVLGLGNLMRTDDAVGMLTTRALEADPRLPAEITVVEGGTLGLDLLGRLDDTTHLLVLDAVDFGAAPGTAMRCAGDDIAKLPTSKSVHLMGLSDLVNVMRLMDLPRIEIVLLGVQPEDTDWGTELTASVAESQKLLVEAALQQIKQWRTAPSVSAASFQTVVPCVSDTATVHLSRETSRIDRIQKTSDTNHSHAPITTLVSS